jgi:tetratricopeptide (TPR) repeat protein
MQRTLVHEIAHACLSDLNLPLWIEEGITQLAEESETASHARFSLDSEKAHELRTYWCAEGLNRFWWGSGFLTPGVDQTLSYALAQVLFRQLVSDYKDQLPAFLLKASANDAGESAAKEVFGISLSQLASGFLGHGNWTPVPEDAIQYSMRGLLHLQRDQYQDSIADFSKSIELKEDQFESHWGLGVAHYLTDRTDAAIAELNRAHELNANDINVLNCLAWICATCPDDEFRDGDRAVELATNACHLTQYTSWSSLFTLAAAYAEAGNMADAQDVANDAIGCSPEREREFCEEMLQCFAAGSPWRDLTREMIESLIGEIDLLNK